MKTRVKVHLGYKNKYYKICWAKLSKDGSILVGFYPGVNNKNIIWATENKSIDSLYEPKYEKGRYFKITLHPDGNNTVGGLNVKLKNKNTDPQRLILKTVPFEEINGHIRIVSYIIHDFESAKVYLESFSGTDEEKCEIPLEFINLPIVVDVFLENKKITNNFPDNYNYFVSSKYYLSPIRYESSCYKNICLTFIIRGIEKGKRIDNESFTFYTHDGNEVYTKLE